MPQETKSKVYTTKCNDYSNALNKNVRNILNRILEDNKELLTAGSKVLIKPNLLTDRTPDKAVTTHPEVVRQTIRFLKNYNVDISVADSPASAVKVQTVWEATGFKSLCQEEDVPLLNLEKSGSKTVVSSGMSFNIAKPVLESDLIISIPKVKTHTLTVLTAAVKNYYGTIPGYQKANMHKTHAKPSRFGRYLARLYEQMPPNINLADGIVGMEGNGPSAGTPVELGFLAASTDAFALDLTLCKILKITPRTVPYLINNFQSWKNIEIIGDQPEKLMPTSFKLPNTLGLRLIPQWLVDCLDPFIWIRPDINDNCTGCKRCIKACPAEAWSIAPNTVKSILNPKLCISCCCCHEVCPEKAIEMKQSPFVNFIRKGKQL